MIEDPQQAHDLLRLILRASQADETQVAVGGGRRHVVRFGNEQIQQNTEESWWQAQITAAYRRRGHWFVGRAQGTDLSPEGVDRLLLLARDSANAAEPDPDYVEAPYPGEFESFLADVSSAYDQRTARVGPAFCANEVASVVLPCHRLGYQCGGRYSVATGSIDRCSNPGLVAVSNSNGLFQHHHPTRVEVFGWIMAPSGGIGWLERTGHGVGEIDMPDLVERAVRRAEIPSSTVEITPGPQRLLLEPAALAAILQLIAPHFSWTALSEGSSFLSGRLGQTLFDPSLTLHANPAHPLLLERPFDAEGWPRRDIPLVEQGTVAEAVYTRRQSRQERVSPSGYAPLAPGVRAAVPENLVMSGQEGSVQDLVETLEEGLLLSRLDDLQWIDEPSWLASARTSQGVLVIRRGRITGRAPDQVLRFQLGVLFQRFARIGQAVRSGEMVVPPVIAEGGEVGGSL